MNLKYSANEEAGEKVVSVELRGVKDVTLLSACSPACMSEGRTR